MVRWAGCSIYICVRATIKIGAFTALLHGFLLCKISGGGRWEEEMAPTKGVESGSYGKWKQAVVGSAIFPSMLCRTIELFKQCTYAYVSQEEAYIWPENKNYLVFQIHYFTTLLLYYLIWAIDFHSLRKWPGQGRTWVLLSGAGRWRTPTPCPLPLYWPGPPHQDSWCVTIGKRINWPSC